MWRVPLFQHRKFQKNTDKFCRSLSLFSPSLSGLSLFGGCTWFGTSPLYACTVVLLGSESIFFPLLAWFRARRDVGYTVCVKSREALHLWCYFIAVAVSRGLHQQRS